MTDSLEKHCASTRDAAGDISLWLHLRKNCFSRAGVSQPSPLPSAFLIYSTATSNIIITGFCQQREFEKHMAARQHDERKALLPAGRPNDDDDDDDQPPPGLLAALRPDTLDPGTSTSYSTALCTIHTQIQYSTSASSCGMGLESLGKHSPCQGNPSSLRSFVLTAQEHSMRRCSEPEAASTTEASKGFGARDRGIAGIAKLSFGKSLT